MRFPKMAAAASCATVALCAFISAPAPALAEAPADLPMGTQPLDMPGLGLMSEAGFRLYSLSSSSDGGGGFPVS